MAQTSDSRILLGAKLIRKCEGNSSSLLLLLAGLKVLFYKQGGIRLKKIKWDHMYSQHNGFNSRWRGGKDYEWLQSQFIPGFPHPDSWMEFSILQIILCLKLYFLEEGVYFLEEGVTSFIIVSIQSMTSAPQTTDLKASTLLYLPYCLNNWQINRWEFCF